VAGETTDGIIREEPYIFFFLFISLVMIRYPTWRILNPPCTIPDELVNFAGREEAKANALFHSSFPPSDICTKGRRKGGVWGRSISKAEWMAVVSLGQKLHPYRSQILGEIGGPDTTQGCKCVPKYSLPMRAFAP